MKNSSLLLKANEDYYDCVPSPSNSRGKYNNRSLSRGKKLQVLSSKEQIRRVISPE